MMSNLFQTMPLLRSKLASCDTSDGPKGQTWQERYPVIRRFEIQKHRTVEDRVWVSHGDGVYDITDFLHAHPGGHEKIMMAAGGVIEPFWEMYPFHKEDAVYAMLAPYKIGTLHPDDKIDPSDLPDFSDLQKDERHRSKTLEIKQQFPLCAETKKEYLTDEHPITPHTEAFIRNHNRTPEFDESFEEDFELELEMKINNKALPEFFELFEDFELKSYTLEDLKQLKAHSVMAQISCAGNRRSHTRKDFPNVKGINWDIGAVMNNKYKGVLLRDLLLDAGFTKRDFKNPEFQKLNLIAHGMDTDF